MADYFLSGGRKHQGYPVAGAAGQLLGVLTRSDVLGTLPDCEATARELLRRRAVTAFSGESWTQVGCHADGQRLAAEKLTLVTRVAVALGLVGFRGGS